MLLSHTSVSHVCMCLTVQEQLKIRLVVKESAGYIQLNSYM